MIQKRNRFSTNSQKSKKIALDFQPLANPKIENMKRRFIAAKRRFIFAPFCKGVFLSAFRRTKYMKFSDFSPQFYIKSSRSVNDCRINDCKIGGWVCIFGLVQKNTLFLVNLFFFVYLCSAD